MKILLVVCPAWGMEMPPLGACLLKSAVESSGHEAEVIDANQYCWNQFPDLRQYWEKDEMDSWCEISSFEKVLLPALAPSLDYLTNKIISLKPDAIGFSLWDSNLNYANILIQKVRELDQGVTLLAGGPQTTFKEMRVKINKVCDYYLVGEGEDALPELLNWMQNGKTGPLPTGFYSFREEVHRDLPYRQVKDLSSLPPPDFSDVAHLKYATPAMPIIVSRSCLFKCRFCSDFASMGSFRKLSESSLIAQLLELYRSGVRTLWFNDLLINGILRELLGAFTTLRDRNHHFQWIALATPNAQLDQATLDKLRELGLKTLNLGLESGSSKVIRLMHKGFNRDNASACLKRIHQAGINTQLNVIVGFPGETEQDFADTLNFLEENKAYISGFTSVNTCILIPGSDIHTRRTELGLMLPPDQNPSLWFDREGNTPQVRDLRLLRLRQWIKDNGYAIYTSNFRPS